MSKKLSLQEQLLQSGLVSNAKAKSIKTEKHKQVQKQRHHNIDVVDETKQLAEQAHTEKVERDRLLNQQRQDLHKQKEFHAQIKQLIEQHRIPIDSKEAEIAYHFKDDTKVKKLYVTELLRDKLSSGKLAIVKDEATYALVSHDIAQKIKERDATQVLVCNEEKTETPQAEDPYASFEIPDDLMW